MSARLTRARLRAAADRRDAGITLTELIVAMGLFSVIGAMTLGIFLSMNASSASTVDRTVNTASARNAIQAWTGYLRASDGSTPGVKTNRFEWLSDDDTLFYADLNNRDVDTPGSTGAATMIWLRLDAAGSLVEEQFPENAGYGTAPTVCRTLVTNVTSAALFTAYNQNAVMSPHVLDLGTVPPASVGCRPLPVTVPSQTRHPDLAAQTNLGNVSSVVIDFVVRDTTNEHPLEFKSQAVLPLLWGGVG